jgi:hypothetical protein
MYPWIIRQNKPPLRHLTSGDESDSSAPTEDQACNQSDTDLATESPSPHIIGIEDRTDDEEVRVSGAPDEASPVRTPTPVSALNLELATRDIGKEIVNIEYE